MREFSAIVGAVQKRDRSTQFCILAALFHLNAFEVPVEVSQIARLLRLHNLDAAKGNLSARLRQYDSLVEVADAGPPLKWKLTSKGIENLRVATGLTLTTKVSTDAHQTDIAFLCALQNPEFSALMDAIGGNSNWTEIGTAQFTHVYRSTTFESNKGTKIRAVGTVSTSMGLTAAAIATTHLVMQYRPKIVVMVGIAAGTRSGGKQFGDVLVADPSVDYNSGKVVQENGIRDFLPDPYPIGLNARLRSVLQKYHLESDVFDRIRKAWGKKLPPGTNRLHLGPLGAADQVIDDATRVLEIQRNWRKLIGVEMETYGVYRACHEAPEPKPRFISFKSVCDFAAEKTDSWQAFAAFTSARFAVEFFRAEWECLWPGQTGESK